MSVPFGVLALIGLVPLGAMLRGLPTGPRASWVDGLAPGRWGWSLVAVQVFVGANAVFGGIQMAANGFGMPTRWLDGTGFSSWVLPGVALLVGVAVPQLLAAGLVATRHRWAVPVSFLAAPRS